jgi:hypothetical protein
VEAGRDDMSAACDHCYAEAFVARRLHGHHDFGTLRFFPERLRDLRKLSPLEEPVISELVAGPKFPASWENTGNFVDSAPRRANGPEKTPGKSGSYWSIPYAS